MFSAFRSPAARRVLCSAPSRFPKAQSRPSFRKFTTDPPPPPPPPPPKSNTALYVGLTLAAAGGLGYYFYTQTESPGVAFKSAAQVVKGRTFTPKKDDYQKVYNKIAEIIHDAGDYDDGSYGPVLLRLAWHSAGTYDKEMGTGGSNYATMRFEPESLHAANAGLTVARNLMEGIKKDFPWITYGDLWTLAGVAAVQEMDGPKIPWRPGRIDGFAKDVTPDGRLPDASQGADHLRAIFGRMGFNDQEIVALSGAHALGRCHTDRSGYTGPWTFSPTTLTNQYFALLFNEKWSLKKWDGPKQYEDKKTKSLMMLPADYVLTQDKSFKKYALAYANDESLFFKDFSAAVAKLFELGVPSQQWATSDPWIMQTLDEQSEQKK